MSENIIERQSRREFIASVSAIVGYAAFGGLLPSCTSERWEAALEKIYALSRAINQYRQNNGLSAIPISSDLTAVAMLHCMDLTQHRYHESCGDNAHSWSLSYRNGGCYVDGDRSTYPIMWEKPRELTDYPGNGYEIVYWARPEATVDGTVTGWHNSPGHKDVMLSQGMWSREPWLALGGVVMGQFACAWFGKVEDPNSTQ